MIEYIDQYGNIKGVYPTDSVNDVKEIVKEVEEYKLSIYPNGYDEKLPDSGRAYLIFGDDKEAWDEYTSREWKFCLKEYDNYLISTHESRNFYRDEFYKRRVTFAKQNDFAPKKGNKSEWFKMKSKDKKVLA